MKASTRFVSLLAGGIMLGGGAAAQLPAAAVSAPLKLYIESDTTTYNKDRRQTFRTKTWVLGPKMRVEMIPQGSGPLMIPSGAPAFAPPGGQMPVMVLDRSARTVYMINNANKSAMRMPMPPEHGLGGPGAIDPTNVEALIKKNGGHKLGEEKIKAFRCDVWEASLSPPGAVGPGGPKPPPARIKLWLSREWKIPVRSEINVEGKGLVLSNLVSLVTSNFQPSAALFQVPSGYKITDISQRPQRPPLPAGAPHQHQHE